MHFRYTYMRIWVGHRSLAKIICRILNVVRLD